MPWHLPVLVMRSRIITAVAATDTFQTDDGGSRESHEKKRVIRRHHQSDRPSVVANPCRTVSAPRAATLPQIDAESAAPCHTVPVHVRCARAVKGNPWNSKDPLFVPKPLPFSLHNNTSPSFRVIYYRICPHNRTDGSRITGRRIETRAITRHLPRPPRQRPH